MGLLLLILSVMVYLPAMRGGFIWDDDEHLTQNPCVVGPQGLREIWTTSAARICPLTLSCFWMQYALWGPNPLPFHIVNIAIHAVNAVLLWRILIRLKVPGAWFGALIWSIHPVQVESVAWITELKNTQSCFFYFLTILFFIKWMGDDPAGTRRERNYVLAVVFALAAMASKSSTVILPLVLGLCAYWQNGRWRWSDAFRLSPFFAFAILSSALSIWTTQLEGADDQQWVRTWPERLITAGNVVWFYLGKLLWPNPLMFIYPKWELKAGHASSYLGIVAVCFMFAVLWWNRHGRMRPVFFAFSYFLVALLPVLGLVEHFFLRYSYVGDHFQYLASAGFIAIVTGVATAACQNGGIVGRRLGMTIGCVVVVVFGMLTWRHERVFADDERLWRDTLAKNQSAWLGHNNFGVLLAARGNFEEGMLHYIECLRLNPNYEKAHNNLGVTLSAQGNHAEAIIHCKEAARLDPNYPDAYYNLGNAFAHQNQFAEAIEQYTEALRLKPNYSEAHNNLGSVLANLGNYAESISHFTEAVRLNPSNLSAQNNILILQNVLNNSSETARP